LLRVRGATNCRTSDSRAALYAGRGPDEP
jgi:hypothetical protein